MKTIRMKTKLYLSPVYGWATKESIKRRVLAGLRTGAIHIDALIKDVVVSLNKLPFVIQTIESCSGHVTFKGPYGGGDAPIGPVLMVMYDKSPAASRFHKRLEALFETSDNDTKRHAEDEDLVKAAAGDVRAICVNCGERVSHCDCPYEQDYKRQLADNRRAVKIQDEITYAVDELPRTIGDLRRFWDKVRQAIRLSRTTRSNHDLYDGI